MQQVIQKIYITVCASSLKNTTKLSVIIDTYMQKSTKNGDEMILKEKASGRSRAFRESLQKHIFGEHTNRNDEMSGRRGGRRQIHDQVCQPSNPRAGGPENELV